MGSRIRQRLRTSLLAALVVTLVASGCVNFEGDPTIVEPTVTPVAPADANESTDGAADDPAPDGSGDTDDSETGDQAVEVVPPTPAPTDPPAPDSESEAGDELAGDRIAIETIDGQVLTIAPDGSDPIMLGDPTDGRFHRQPTWAPDGSRVAWVALDPSGQNSQVRTSRFDLTGALDVDVDSAPFYLSWAPDAATIGYLAPVVGGIDLGIVDLEDEGSNRRLDRGEPYFFSWGRDADEMFVHASGFRLDRIDFEGSTNVIEEFPARFQAPVWIRNDRTLVYADQVEGEQFLVTAGERGEGRLELLTFSGYLVFSVNPATGRIAMINRAPNDDGGIVTASFQQDELPIDIVDELPPGGLWTMGLYGGDIFPLSFGDVLAFWWSPVDDVLAWIETTSRSDVLQWWFASGADTWPGPEFTPSGSFIQSYVPFHDQYSQSSTFFNPEGTKITFSGRLRGVDDRGLPIEDDGIDRVWVVDIEPGAEPEAIAEGTYSTWSPTSAGGAASSL